MNNEKSSQNEFSNTPFRGMGVFCFGELLLRMSPELDGKWIREAAMPVFLGGAELNVATALAKWNIPVRYFTALPDHYLGKDILAFLQSKNIDISKIHFSGDRIGTFYLPQGADLKSAGVIYDRAGSSFASLKPGMINWDDVLQGCTWFHFSAICPALNADAAAVCREALEAASAKGITVSVDLNYRAKLWKYGKDPVDVMPDLLQHCHIVMGNLWAAETLLGISSGVSDSTGKTRSRLIDAAGKSMLQIHQQYPAVRTMAYTFRMEKNYWAVLQHGADMMFSKEHDITQVVDKAGSGDCFMGGLIYGLYHQLPAQEIINYAASAAVGKLQEKGDTTSQNIEQIKARY